MSMRKKRYTTIVEPVIERPKEIYKSRAERLFDEIVGRPNPSYSRISNILAAKNEPLMSNDPCKNDIRKAQRRPLKDVLNEVSLFEDHPAKTYSKKVCFAEDSSFIKPKVKKRTIKKTRGTLCTPQAVAEAFAKANLPDFEAIAKQELNIVVREPWESIPKPEANNVSVKPKTTQDIESPNECDLTIEQSFSVGSPDVTLIPSPKEVQKTRFFQSPPEIVITSDQSILHSTPYPKYISAPHYDTFNIFDKKSSQRNISLKSCIMQQRNHKYTSTPVSCKKNLQISNVSNILPSPSKINLSTHISFGHNSSLTETLPNVKWLVQKRGNNSTASLPNLSILSASDRGPVLRSLAFEPSTTLVKLGNQIDTQVSQYFGSSSIVRTNVLTDLNSSAKDHKNYYRKSILSVASALIAEGKSCRSVLLKKPVRTQTKSISMTKLTLQAAFSTACVTIDGKEVELSPQEKVLAFCNPPCITNFFVALKDLLNDCVKIGEGSYGEVFKSTSESKEVVFKIMPLNMNLDINTIFLSLLPELTISHCFNDLRTGQHNNCDNFVNLLSASCVKGVFPEKLVKEWEVYDKNVGSENEHPLIYTEKNIYLVLLFGNGGKDLEKYQFRSAEEALSIFLQIAYALAVAECEFEFEHRDLHWGNILIMSDGKSVCNYRVKRKEYSVPSYGKKVSIIDFSLSRVSKNGFIIFDDLEKYEDLFKGGGDYQFEIYRMMRKENHGNWKKFCPKTNVFWCDYILQKLIEEKKYKARSKAHYAAINLLKKIRMDILNYSSMQQLISKSPILRIYCK